MPFSPSFLWRIVVRKTPVITEEFPLPSDDTKSVGGGSGKSGQSMYSDASV